ncbi:hypothetical protein EYF80_001094 [Liparis tanakae]|uniref:Uncharacterized protein n=1 Tax=Liparis tanakae TaxID=230148 RepID=A0A4Z2JHM2_9TELE|nr:hypothetical protein EYF80_001094 [Liparis tanakae]
MEYSVGGHNSSISPHKGVRMYRAERPETEPASRLHRISLSYTWVDLAVWKRLLRRHITQFCKGSVSAVRQHRSLCPDVWTARTKQNVMLKMRLTVNVEAVKLSSKRWRYSACVPLGLCSSEVS